MSTTDFPKLAGAFAENAYPAMVDDLAKPLGVSADALYALGLGFAPKVIFKKGSNYQGWWAFPARDEDGKIIGLALRKDAVKVSYSGSNVGLFYAINPNHKAGQESYQPGRQNWIRTMEAGVPCPICGKPDGCLLSAENPADPKAVICRKIESAKPQKIGYLHIRKDEGNVGHDLSPLPPSDFPVVVVEGYTDVAAAHDLGLVAVGRPSNLAGLQMLGKLLRGRDVWILGENDRKADGDWPGKKGMEAAFATLMLSAKSVRMALPPEQFKDLREWKIKDAALTKETFKAWMEKNGQTQTDRPIIEITGNTIAYIEQSQRILIENDEPIYAREQTLVTPIIVSDSNSRRLAEADHIQRAPGSLVLQSVTHLYMLRALNKHATWVRKTPRGELRQVDPPDRLAHHLIDNMANGPYRRLHAIIVTPTLRADGSILQVPGYDEASQVILSPNASFPAIPESPTRDGAMASLASFWSVFSGFPWVSPADYSVYLAAVLTSLIRPSLRTAPLFGINAAIAGTGKSKLMEAVGEISLGHTPPLMTVAEKDEEVKKQLDAILRRGDAIVCMDNVSRPLRSDQLCVMTTNPYVQIRVLGKTEELNCPATCTILATGNNLTIQGDLCRRTLISNLDANMERPDLRHFDFDPVSECRRRRAELVIAGLTILRAYAVAGFPMKSKLVPFGSFDDFDWIRGAIVWLGLADPCDTRGEIFRNDDSRQSLAEAMQLWHELVGESPCTLKDVRDKWGSAPYIYGPLVESLCEAVGVTSGGGFSAKQIGSRLRRHKNTIANGLKLEQPDFNRIGVALWRIVKI